MSEIIESIPDFDTEIACFTPRQTEALILLDSGRIKFLLYGGALGGGKSYFLRWYGIRRLIALYQVFHIKNAVGMLCCENYPSLKDRQLSKIGREAPSWIGTMHQDHKEYGRCFILAERWGSGVLCFRNLDDPSKYASAEFAFILPDELTKNNYDTFTHLRTRLRWPGLPDVECQFVSGTNPGSIGHGWVKALWMDKSFADEWIHPIDFRSQFAYVPSLADDNPHLDASYWAMLETLPEALRKAFRYGDWNIFEGQAFPEFSQVTHVIKPLPIPKTAPIIVGFDWGFGAPFSIGWYWVDGDGRLYRFAEWYGWNKQPNQGLRLSDTDIVNGIIEREEFQGWHESDDYRPAVYRVANPDIFNKKPDYMGGGQGKPTAEVFGEHNIFFSIGDPARHLKIRQFRERLRVPKDGTAPMLLVYDNCKQFIRTIPNLVLDDHNIEDVETSGEDHIYDECAVVCMARPLAMAKPQLRPMTDTEKDMFHITGIDYRLPEGERNNPEESNLAYIDEQELNFERQMTRGAYPGRRV